MNIKQFEIYWADLSPRFGTEAGKIRPVIVVQTNLLNKIHPSTLICPLTTNIKKEAQILRIHLKKGQANIEQNSDIMTDQIRAIDKRRLQEKIGILPKELMTIFKENLKIILDLG